MRKKFVLVSVMAAFLTGLTGCGSGGKSGAGETDKAGATDAAKEITLTVTSYLNSEERIKLMDQTIAIFNKKYPNVTIKNTPDGGNYEQNLKLAFQSGEGQDIVYLDDARQQMLQKNNYLMDLTEDIKNRGWPDKQIAGAIEYNNLRTPGTNYSVPFLMAPVVVFYNKKIFEDLNLTPPATVDEFNAILQKVKAAGKIPMENAGLNNFNMMWSTFSLLYGRVPMEDVNKFYYLKETTKAFADGMVSSLTTVNDWVGKEYYRKDMSSIDYNAIPTLFAKGETAMVVDGDWNLPAYKDTGFPVGAFAFPVTDKNLPNTIVNSTDGAWALNAQLTPEKKEAALNFIDIFMDPEVVKIWSEAGLTSSVKTDSSSYNLPPLRQELNKAISSTNMGFYLDNAIPGIGDVMVKEMQKMMLKEINPQQCWDNIKAGYDKLLAQTQTKTN